MEQETPMVDIPKSVLRLTMEATGLVVAGTFLAGMMAGYLDASQNDSWLRWFGPAAIMIAATVFAGWKLLQMRTSVNLSLRQRRYALSFLIATIVGAVIGVWLQFSGHMFRDALAGKANVMTAETAIILTAVYAVGMAISMIFYHRGIDDHEERAWLWAGLFGWYAFVFPAPAWMILASAKVVPPVDAFVLLVFSAIVNAIAWLWLKFR